MCQTVLIFTKRIDTFRSGGISKFGPKNQTRKLQKRFLTISRFHVPNCSNITSVYIIHKTN